MRISIIALTICFSIVCGCSALRGSSKPVWPLPPHPGFTKVDFIPVGEIKKPDSGYYISRDDAVSLADNVDELKAYMLKLEVLLKQISDTYGIRMKEKKVEE